MRHAKLDRLFDRFRRKGDVAALGELFDRTAPELARVAMSLVRDPGEADDLLQATYLTAIEKADGYDDRRRLLPWLLGILVHHAHASRRRRMREVDPERLAPPSPEWSATPDRRVELEELSDVVVRALSELPERDRAVLEPFLREGRRPAEIAQASGEAPGAVRMRIHRGLERLRRILPRGVGLGLGATLVGGSGFAAVRAEVVARGAQTAGTLAAAASVPISKALLGGLAVKKTLTIVGAAAVLGGTLWYARPQPAEPVVAAVPNAKEATPAEPVEVEQVVAAQPSAPLRESAPAVDRAPSASVYERALSGVHGRVVEASGEPVPGLELALVEIQGLAMMPAIGAALEGKSAPLDLVRDRTRTDAEGRFELRGVHARALHMLAFDPGGPRGAVRLLDVGLEPGESRDLGDVALSPRATLAGRVVDEQGDPVAGARVRAARLQGAFLGLGLTSIHAESAILLNRDEMMVELPSWVARYERDLPVATTHTAADGTFTLDGLSLGGPKTRELGIEFTLVVDREGFAPTVRSGIDLAEGQVLQLDSLQLGRGVEVGGRVVDASGEPVVDAEVRAGSWIGEDGPVGALLSAPVRSDASGQFTVSHLEGDRSAEYLVAVRGRAGDAWTFVRCTPAEGRCEVSLAGSGVLRVKVMTADEEPVADAQLWVSGAQASGTALAGFFELPPAAADVVAPGEYHLRGLPSGHYVVFARAPGFALEGRNVELTAGGAELPLFLPRARALSVEVVDGVTQTPIAEAEVVVVREGIRGRPACQARTDEAGQARMDAPLARTRDEQFALRVAHPGFAVSLLSLADGEERVRVELTHGATLRATVRDGLAVPTEQLLMSIRKRDALHSMAQFALFDERGELSLTNLQPGEYRYSVGGRFLFDSPLESIGGGVNPKEFTSGRFTLVEGETLELDVQLQPVPEPMRWGELSGSVRLDGAPLAGASVKLGPPDDGEDLQATTDAAGQFDFGQVPSGRSYLTISRTGSSGRGSPRRVLARFVEVEPGAREHLEFDWTLRMARIEVVRGDDGRPVEGAYVSLRAAEHANEGMDCASSTDERGVVALPLLAAGTYDLRVQHAEVGLSESSVLVRPGESELSRRIELHPGAPCAGRVSVRGVEIPEGELVFLIVERAGEMRSVHLTLVDGETDYQIAGLEPGEYTARVWILDRESPSLPLVIPELGDTQLDLTFEFDRWKPARGR